MEPVRLTQLTCAGGCGAKLSPGVLGALLAHLPRVQDPNLLVGYDASDDAAVYRISDEVALLQTVDFFPPIVDDPYTFGQIAAVNALSDIYAMGGTPILALNLLAFPPALDPEIAGAILAGGADKVHEAGAVLAGGHSIEDQEPKYGLCVTGTVHPDRVLTNSGAREGDILVLTKPIGVGVLSTAARGGLLSKEDEALMTGLLTTLNRAARDGLLPAAPNACTDVTGFSLLGHGSEMAQGCGCTLELWADRVPILPQALTLARDGLVPGGAYRNRNHFGPKIFFDPSLPLEVTDLLFDPQTAGGLLAALPEDKVPDTLRRLNDLGLSAAAVGRMVPQGEHLVRVLKGR